MEKEHLAPSPEASRETLLRRLYLDLLGLLPTPAERDAFLADPSPDAYQRLVDRLLASPHFGQRRAAIGSTWLATATATATNSDNSPPQSPCFRDWVVQAINHDLP